MNNLSPDLERLIRASDSSPLPGNAVFVSYRMTRNRAPDEYQLRDATSSSGEGRLLRPWGVEWPLSTQSGHSPTLVMSAL
jgi:hypothetical protein